MPIYNLVIANEQLVANEFDASVDTEAVNKVDIDQEEHYVQYAGSWIIAASLISVKREPPRDGRGAYVVLLDDEHLIVHLVVQRTLIAYTIWTVICEFEGGPSS